MCIRDSFCIIAGGVWPPAFAKGEGGGTSTAKAGAENAMVAAASIAARECAGLNPSPFIAIAGAIGMGLTAHCALIAAVDCPVNADGAGALVPIRMLLDTMKASLDAISMARAPAFSFIERMLVEESMAIE